VLESASGSISAAGLTSCKSSPLVIFGSGAKAAEFAREGAPMRSACRSWRRFQLPFVFFLVRSLVSCAVFCRRALWSSCSQAEAVSQDPARAPVFSRLVFRSSSSVVDGNLVLRSDLGLPINICQWRGVLRPELPVSLSCCGLRPLFVRALFTRYHDTARG
jgi:hypothetical protein